MQEAGLSRCTALVTVGQEEEEEEPRRRRHKVSKRLFTLYSTSNHSCAPNAADLPFPHGCAGMAVQHVEKKDMSTAEVIDLIPGPAAATCTYRRSRAFSTTTQVC